MQVSSKRVRKTVISADNLSYTGEDRNSEVLITLFHYDKDSYSKKQIADLSRIYDVFNMKGIKWINVDGIHDPDIVESIGMQFGIDFLVLEDILDVNQRPKVENHGKYLYIVVKMVYMDKKTEKIISEHVSLLLFKNTVITFQEQLGYDVFDPIRNKIINNRGKIRRESADFLTYSLLDSIIDNYISVMDIIGEDISQIEKEILTNPTSAVLEEIYNLKMDVIFFRKSISPALEVIIQLQKSDSDLFKDSLQPYLRDIYDHTLQALDSIKIYNETIAGILEIYSSSVNNKTNKVIERLTLINSIFMPLTVIAGIGGMSEWSMMTGPENWRVSYPLFLLLLAVIGFITFLLLRRSFKS